MTAPKKKDPITTKLDAEVLRQAKTIDAYRGIDLYDYLHSILADRVAQDFRKIVKADTDGKAEKGGKS